MFITFEGVDGSGKTTALEGLKNHLKKKGIEFIFTREPGSELVDATKKIRAIILDKKTKISAMTEAILYMADRRTHLENIIWPSLKKGIVVLCDRYIDSSLAYQGNARNLGFKKILYLNKTITDNTFPDLTIYFDLSPSKASSRLKGRANEKEDRLDAENFEFKQKVYEGYKKVIKKFKKRIKIVDASKPKEVVLKNVIDIFDNYYQKKKKTEK